MKTVVVQGVTYYHMLADLGCHGCHARYRGNGGPQAVPAVCREVVHKAGCSKGCIWRTGDEGLALQTADNKELK